MAAAAAAASAPADTQPSGFEPEAGDDAGANGGDDSDSGDDEKEVEDPEEASTNEEARRLFSLAELSPELWGADKLASHPVLSAEAMAALSE